MNLVFLMIFLSLLCLVQVEPEKGLMTVFQDLNLGYQELHGVTGKSFYNPVKSS